jgi:hypothetical protein
MLPNIEQTNSGDPVEQGHHFRMAQLSLGVFDRHQIRFDNGPFLTDFRLLRVGLVSRCVEDPRSWQGDLAGVGGCRGQELYERGQTARDTVLSCWQSRWPRCRSSDEPLVHRRLLGSISV